MPSMIDKTEPSDKRMSVQWLKSYIVTSTLIGSCCMKPGRKQTVLSNRDFRDKMLVKLIYVRKKNQTAKNKLPINIYQIQYL